MKKITILGPLAILVTVGVLVGACAGSDDGAGSDRAQAESAAASPPDVSTDQTEAAMDRAVEEDVAAAGGGSAGEAGSLPIDVAAQLPGIEQRVIQTAMLALTVPGGQFDETIDRARSVTSALGGFVTSSSASQDVGEQLVRGSLVVRVPQHRYADAMEALGGLGTVRGREESGQDVTLQYVDLEARERHLASVERQLLGFLDETTTVADALVVQQQLNDVQLQLEQVRGELRYLDGQTSYATISLDVAERGAPPAGGGGDGWGIRDAWSAAAGGLEAIAGGLLIALVTAGPILLVLGALAAGWRLHSRRRKTAPEGQAGPAAG